MPINKFEEIKAWQEARKLTKDIYEMVRGKEFSRDFGLIDQIRRAAVSIMANIAEGFGSQSDEEFIRFLRYADRSASEVQSHLYVALDQGYVSKNRFTRIYEQVVKTKELILGFIRYLRKK